MSEDKAERRCGPCSQCCKVFDVPELQSPAGEWCRHVKRGGGCGAYETRPQVCRGFLCQWVLDPSIPHRFRPDLTKVVLSAAGDEARPSLVANCDPGNPLAWRREPIYGLLKHQARSRWGRLVVVAKAGPRTWLVLPDEDRDLGDIPPRQTIEVDQHPDGRWDVRIVDL